MLLHVVHIAACLASLGDTTLWVPEGNPIPTVDTVHIRADRSEFANVGRKEVRLNSSEGIGLLTQNMQEAAQFFKEYGVSGSATISKRGADATQTQVLWNGLPINHPMLGMMDFNGVATFGMDELVLIEGGNSAMYGSGSVGGTVMLNNKASFNSPMKIKTVAEINALRNSQMGFQLGKGWKNTYVNVASSWINQNNEFVFFDPIKQQNRNAYNSHLDHQNIRLVAAHNVANHSVKLISELGKVNRGLGFLYGSEQALGQQVDRQSRNLLQYDFHKRNLHFTQKVGYTSDRLVYIAQGQTGDTSTAEMLFLQTEMYHQTQWGKSVWGLDYQVQKGNSSYYQMPEMRILPALFSAWKSEIGKTNYLINARYEFNEQVLTGGLGTQTHINQVFSIKTDIHRSFRRPTLNDLYWEVTQRNQLVPEIGWGSELGLVWNSTLLHQLTCIFELTPFYRELNNPIIWLPQGAYWAAQNMNFGQYAGVQISAHINQDFGVCKVELNENFEWVRSAVKSQANSDFKQQIFVPDVISTSAFALKFKSASLKLLWQKVGNRYTATDNSQYLPFYQLFSLEGMFKASFWGKFKQNSSECRVGVRNIFDVSYQNMPGRPMPPRNAYVQINLNF
jgi:iron complex outermembrane receptor protein